MNTKQQTSPSNVSAYDESSIRVLKGLEPVRERPGMYTRTDSPTHIIQEVIDNAADEALGGYATVIEVSFADDGAVTVSDNGRGIPVGLHPTEKVPVVTLAFTRLHAGGKFDKNNGGAYAFSGGLHGVGVAVTTALSKLVRVQVSRNGKLHQVEYADGGRKIGKVEELGDSPGGASGTTVSVWPDPKYFETPKVQKTEIERLLRAKAVLLPGVTVKLTIDGHTKEWMYTAGLPEYLAEMAGDREAAAPAFIGEKYHIANAEDGDGESLFANGEGAAFAFAWYPEGAMGGESFVNLIPTPSGGTHDSGLKAGIFEAVKTFIEHHALLPRGVKLQQEDVAARMGYVLSAKVLDPQFQGQIKEKLNNRTAHKLVATMVRNPFEIWLNANVEAGKAIAGVAIKQAMLRQKSGQNVEKRKSSGVTVLPGKLAECESTEDNELFLVEGDSAGGSAKMGRNRENQAILPLRGKVLNTWEVEPGRLFANKEVHDLSVAMGVEPHDFKADEGVLSNARYSRIVIMTDADVDGAHIRTLLLTLFYRHFPRLLTSGRVFVAQCPLYRIDVAPGGKSKPARRIYALDEAELSQITNKLKAEGVREERYSIGRFKGLGEMNPEQLKETAMDPATRRVIPVRFNEQTRQAVDSMFTLLMGKDHASSRRTWMTAKGSTVEADV